MHVRVGKFELIDANGRVVVRARIGKLSAGLRYRHGQSEKCKEQRFVHGTLATSVRILLCALQKPQEGVEASGGHSRRRSKDYFHHSENKLLKGKDREQERRERCCGCEG